MAGWLKQTAAGTAIPAHAAIYQGIRRVMDYTMKKLAAAMFIAGLSLAGTAQAQTAEDVKVGFAGPMTGAQAHYGKDFQNGVVLAAEDFNATKPAIGGKPDRILLDSPADQAAPRTGTTRAQKLRDDNI